MDDLYRTLGVNRSASAEEIKRAYRQLASQHHPDKGGDTAKFQQIQSAYDILGDAQKRAEYDQPRPSVHQHGFAPGAANFNFDEIFEMFGARFAAQGFNRNQNPRQVRMQLWIGLEDVARGGPRMVNLGSGAVEIMIPDGVDDGDTVRYSHLGPNGNDVIITFRVSPNQSWRRTGADIATDKAISVWDLILGTEVSVYTLHGSTVQVSVPAGTQPGTMLRVRGHGLPKKQQGQRGDLLLKLQAYIPESIPDHLREQIKKMRDH